MYCTHDFIRNLHSYDASASNTSIYSKYEIRLRIKIFIPNIWPNIYYYRYPPKLYLIVPTLRVRYLVGITARINYYLLGKDVYRSTFK